LKYLRKWHYNFMLYHHVPESVADFIQGRSSKSISANHYLAKAQQADFWYGKIAGALTKVFSDNKRISGNGVQMREVPLLLQARAYRDYSEVRQ
jgi:hypothetical protein